MDDLGIPAPLARTLQRSGVQTIAQLSTLDDETLRSVPFLDLADIAVLRAAVAAYWQRIQSYADSAPTPTDRRAVTIWLRRQQGTPTAEIATDLGIASERIYRQSHRGARYVAWQEAQRRQEPDQDRQ